VTFSDRIRYFVVSLLPLLSPSSVLPFFQCALFSVSCVLSVHSFYRLSSCDFVDELVSFSGLRVERIEKRSSVRSRGQRVRRRQVGVCVSCALAAPKPPIGPGSCRSWRARWSAGAEHAGLHVENKRPNSRRGCAGAWVTGFLDAAYNKLVTMLVIRRSAIFPTRSFRGRTKSRGARIHNYRA